MDNVQFPDPFNPVTDPDAAWKAVRQETEIRRIGIETVPGILRFPLHILGVPGLDIAEGCVRVIDEEPSVYPVGIDLRRFAEQGNHVVGLDIGQGDVRWPVLDPLRPEREEKG